MRIERVDTIGETLAIRWDDGSESFLRLESLRRHCPCAGCKGEVDIMGNLYKGPERVLGLDAFVLRGMATVGGYGLQPTWADGHNSGIFSFDYLRRLAESDDEN